MSPDRYRTIAVALTLVLSIVTFALTVTTLIVS